MRRRGKGNGRRAPRMLQHFLVLQPAAGLIYAYLLVKQADNLQLFLKYRGANQRKREKEMAKKRSVREREEER